MENPRPKWQWPTKRLQQVFFVLLALSLLAQIYVLGGQLFNGERIRVRSSPLGITIGLVVSALIWSIGAAGGIFATLKCNWGVLGTAFCWWAMALKDVAGHVPVDRRFFLEVLVTLTYGASSVAFGISVLRGDWNKDPCKEQSE